MENPLFVDPFPLETHEFPYFSGQMMKIHQAFRDSYPYSYHYHSSDIAMVSVEFLIYKVGFPIVRVCWFSFTPSTIYIYSLFSNIYIYVLELHHFTYFAAVISTMNIHEP